MTKSFKLVKGDLHVTVKAENAVYLPHNGKSTDVGKYTQVTVQKIQKDKIEILEQYIKGELDTGKKQLKDIKKQLEPIKDLTPMDEKLQEKAVKAIQKGSKAFKTQLVNLNQHLINLSKKKNFEDQLTFLEKQLGEMQEDLDALHKAIK